MLHRDCHTVVDVHREKYQPELARLNLPPYPHPPPQLVLGLVIGPFLVLFPNFTLLFPLVFPLTSLSLLFVPPLPLFALFRPHFS